MSASEHLDEVNILAFGYGDKIADTNYPIIEFDNSDLYAGPITKTGDFFSSDGFIDIVKIGASPPKTQIWKSLLNKVPIGVWEW